MLFSLAICMCLWWVLMVKDTLYYAQLVYNDICVCEYIGILILVAAKRGVCVLWQPAMWVFPTW